MARLALVGLLAACTGARGHQPDAGSADTAGDDTQQGCGALPNCYSVYAHSNTTLYVVDLMAKTLSVVGPFKAPGDDIMTDLAVAPDNTIYVISATKLYTASPVDGHVTAVGSLAACGSFSVALTTLPSGQMWTGDYSGKLCQIDTTTSPPTVKPPITMGSGLALSGDLVAIDDGTVFGTAYRLSDPATGGTNLSNLLVTIDLATGAVKQLGSSGYPRLFGTSFTGNKVIGFTHDGSGRVVAIDTTTGAGSLYATFMDPTTHMPIAFAGAGVNSLVPIIL